MAMGGPGGGPAALDAHGSYTNLRQHSTTNAQSPVRA